MHGEDFEFEEIEVTVTEGSALEELEFVVGSFERAGGDGMVVPIQQAGAVAEEGCGELLQDSDATALSLFGPGRQAAFGAGFRGLVPQLPQIFLEVVRGRQRFIEGQRDFQAGRFEFAGIEVFGIAQ